MFDTKSSPMNQGQRKMVSLDPSRTGRDATELESSLRRMIVGQDEAIEQIVNIYQMHLTGMNPPGRPIGNFLFLGPTGTGKTRIVEATAEALVRNPRAVIKIDCGEFQHSHEIAKLIGSPPGYLGHRETHPLLSQETLSQYHTDTMKVSFVLFDEIEKASDSLWNLLLGILDKGTLTLGDNRKVDFSRALIFMTSNLGAAEMSQITTPRLGFGSLHALEAAVSRVDEKLGQKVEKTGLDAAKRKFTPEFINRLDKIVVFKPLGEGQLRRILDLELNMVQQRVFNTGDSLSGNSIASLLLGVLPSGGNNGADYNVLTSTVQHYYAPYIQDDWKITRKLTVNLGLRWDFNYSPFERYDRLNRGFDPNVVNPIDKLIDRNAFPGFPTVKGALRFAGVNGDRHAGKLDWTAIQPRVGFAYQLRPKTVVLRSRRRPCRARKCAPTPISPKTRLRSSMVRYTGR